MARPGAWLDARSPKLRRAVGLALALLASSAVGATACNVTDATLVGSWEATGKGATFEQLAFEREGSRREFNSWRHDRPEISQAQWRLQDCKLTIHEAPDTTQTFTVLLRGQRLWLSAPDGRAAGAYRRIEEPRAGAAELRTPTYLVRITENCPEGEVGCRDVLYEGRNNRTGRSIALKGQAVMRPCADRVTPCSHEGYRFRSGEVDYRVTHDGRLLVTQGSKVLVDEQGQWQAGPVQQPAAADPLVQRLGIQLPSDYPSARARLLRGAWKPDAAWGRSGASGRLAHAAYPEILCGEGYDAVCTGRFEKGDEAVLLVLDRGTRTLRVTAIERD
jgi:hypothetical protein